jgi:CheY-like chemotaxis protein
MKKTADAPIRVLVADDFHDGAEALGDLLRMSGCEVVVTRTGAEAVEVAKTLQPSLVIVDLHMPGMNGFDTIAAIKQQPWANEAVYVAYTANDHPAIIGKVRQAGFQHYVLKASPYERFEEILAAVQVPPKD